MTGLFEWLLKFLFIALLAPFFLCLFLQLVVASTVALLPWVIGLAVLVALIAGTSAGLILRRRLPPRPERLPPGEIPRIRRPRGVRTER